MTRKTAVLAIVALMVVGTSAALAVGSGPAATGDAPLAQDTETTTENETAAEGETTQAEEATTTAEGQVGAESARVTFLNQSAGFTFTGDQPNETTVMIERVVVPEGGFLVLHEARNTTGEYATEGQVEVGAVVGNSTYLEPGVHSNVVVELNETVNSSQTLVAMPHRDTNDNRQYDFPEADEPYTRNGSPVIDTGYVIVEYDAIDLTFGETTTAAGDETAAAANETTTEA
ncbi:hypothetical protein M0R89_16455 [Halorussus limi]|uniref:DUF7282 domain-containing protein n=1 Tax=Halorussus limi TaxID=2938695 RepID=A0A8U0HTA4_9EURY|nr:hypothetical protein [Halorussus limi]UPV74118.1 hypothetical protein M0R89_16455 [Halorussus limi]